MKTLILFEKKGLLLDGLAGLFAQSNDFELIRKEQSLSRLADTLKGIPPNFIIIGSSLLDSAHVCEECVACIQRASKVFDKGIIHTVVLIEQNDQIFLDHYHAFGFHGFIFEQTRFSELEQSLKALYQGAFYLPSLVAERQAQGLYGLMQHSKLTRRELQVLQRISMGSSSKEISANLGIAVSTVDVYRKRLLTKIGVHSVAELTKYAVKMGLTAL